MSLSRRVFLILAVAYCAPASAEISSDGTYQQTTPFLSEDVGEYSLPETPNSPSSPPSEFSSCPSTFSPEAVRGYCPHSIAPECLPNPNLSSKSQILTPVSLVFDGSGSVRLEQADLQARIIEEAANNTSACFICGCNGEDSGQCKYYAGSAISRKIENSHAYNRTRMFTSTDQQLTANQIESLSCVQQWIKEAEDYVRSDGREHHNRYVHDRLDRQQHVAQVYEKNGNNFDSMILKNFFWLAEKYHGVPELSFEKLRTPVTFVMDEQCKPVSTDSASDICGSFMVSAITSPISLIWEEGADIDENKSVVEFPLDPTKVNGVYTWKASAKTPLLVYDPLHTGRIVSAAQLFGDWTFYNHPQAAGLDRPTTLTKKPWENGFEALASLDKNGDRKISETELEPLSLWFDKNRDGVSQSGEVTSTLNVGIKELYFDNLTHNPVTKDVTARVGFLRARPDGSNHTGRAIDWYAKHGETELELIHKSKLQEQLSEKLEQSSELENSITRLESADNGIASETNSGNKSLLGIWNWSLTALESNTTPKHGGYLVFGENNRGEISGVSIIESSVTNSSDTESANRILSYVPLSNIRISRDSKVITFESRDKNGNFSKHSANFSRKNNSGTLVGQSNLKEGQKGSLNYAWQASKLAN